MATGGEALAAVSGGAIVAGGVSRIAAAAAIGAVKSA